jgi:hypothetical protein
MVNPTASSETSVSIASVNGSVPLLSLCVVFPANSLLCCRAVTGTLALHAPDNYGGNFFVTSQSAGGPLTLNFTQQPAESTLFLNASVSKGPASVSLPIMFEGNFSIFSNKPHIILRRQMMCPIDRHSIRNITYNRDGSQTGLTTGMVRWMPIHHNRALWGEVLLKAANLPTTLML